MKTWSEPVNRAKHEELISKGWRFVESRWEWEFAVSKYERDGQILRVESSGRTLSGEK